MCRKIVLVNETLWPTAPLRRIIVAAAGSVGVRMDKFVTVRSCKSSLVRGSATAGQPGREGQGVILWLPSPNRNGVRDHLEELSRELAVMAAHEFMHTRGVRHRDMTIRQRQFTAVPTWAKGMVLAAPPVKAPEPATERGARLREKRAAHACTMYAKAAARLKRAKTLELKWRKKVRYYRDWLVKPVTLVKGR